MTPTAIVEVIFGWVIRSRAFWAPTCWASSTGSTSATKCLPCLLIVAVTTFLRVTKTAGQLSRFVTRAETGTHKTNRHPCSVKSCRFVKCGSVPTMTGPRHECLQVGCNRSVGGGNPAWIMRRSPLIVKIRSGC